jgi:hypothetical protein
VVRFLIRLADNVKLGLEILIRTMRNPWSEQPRASARPLTRPVHQPASEAPLTPRCQSHVAISALGAVNCV